MVKKKNNQIEQDKDKKLLLWSAVIFFIVLIFALWLFSLPSLLKSPVIDEQEDFWNFNWQEISDKLSGDWSDLKLELERDKELLPIDDNQKDIFDTATSTDTSTASSTQKQDFEQLKTNMQELQEIMDQFKQENCSSEVKCEIEKDCQIPAGCEDITQIVY